MKVLGSGIKIKIKTSKKSKINFLYTKITSICPKWTSVKSTKGLVGHFLAGIGTSDSSLSASTCIVASSPFVLVVDVTVFIGAAIVLVVLVGALVEVEFVVAFVLHVV